MNGKGAPITLGGGIGPVAKPVDVPHPDMRFHQIRRTADCGGEMVQCALEVACLAVQKAQKGMSFCIGRLTRQNAFAYHTRSGKITALMQRPRVLELCRCRAPAPGRTSGAALQQHLPENGKQHQS